MILLRRILRCISSMSNMRRLGTFSAVRSNTKGEVTVDFELGGFSGRLLRSSQEIMAAQHLLFKVYIEEMQWKFDRTSPTGFKIKSNRYLVDNFDKHAKFFGVFCGRELAATIRLVVETNSLGSLDLGSYFDVQPKETKLVLKQLLTQNPLEVQRVAVNSGFRRLGLAKLAMSCTTAYSYLSMRNIIGAPANVGMKMMMLKAFFTDTGALFHFGDDDYVSLLSGDWQDMKSATRVLRSQHIPSTIKGSLN